MKINDNVVATGADVISALRLANKEGRCNLHPRCIIAGSEISVPPTTIANVSVVSEPNWQYEVGLIDAGNLYRLLTCSYTHTYVNGNLTKSSINGTCTGRDDYADFYNLAKRLKRSGVCGSYVDFPHSSQILWQNIQ